MKKNICMAIPVVWLCIVMALPSQAQDRKTEISSILPGTGEAGEWLRPDSARVFTGDELFDYIDGGADIYFEYGFRQVISAEYRNPKKTSVKVEIYEMTDDNAAYGIYSINIQSQGKTVRIGNEGTLNENYLVFWKDRFLTFISSDDTTGETLEGILTLAECVEKKIDIPGKKPELVAQLPLKNLQRGTSVRGLLGLSSVYDFDTKNIFGVREGVIGIYKNYRVFLFRYETENDAGKWYSNAREILRYSARMSNFQDQGQRYGMTDRKGSRVYVVQREKLVVIVIADQETDGATLCDDVLSKINK
jgi:hypothetical protein